MSSTIVADVLASHSGKSDRREWHTVGAWLHFGERIVIVGADDAAPPALQPLTTDQIVKLWNESIANGAVLGLSDTVLFARAVEHAHGIKEAK